MINNPSSIQYAGDVNVDSIILSNTSGKRANILAQVVSIELFEDIYKPFRTINITMKESVDYINQFPFVGEEYIDLKIFTPTLNDWPIEGRFYIYKIVDRTYTKQREVMYIMKGISIEWIKDTNIKISQSLKGNCSDIAKTIITKLETKKNINIDETINQTSFVACYWSPTTCLGLLSSNAISSEQSPSFLFYENQSGFNFKSINSLLKAKPVQIFYKDNYTRDYDASGPGIISYRNIEEDFRRIQGLSINSVTNYQDEIEHGSIKSQIITYDAVKQKYEIMTYDRTKDKTQNLLNKNIPMKSPIADATSSQVVMSKHFSNFTGHSDVTNASTILARKSFFINLEKYKVLIEVFGRCDYTIGQVMELRVPRVAEIPQKNLNGSEDWDPVISGKYLCTAIGHYITRENHRCTIELVKNSVNIDL